MEKKILVCWDGSDQSMNALRYAIDEAKDKGLQTITAVFVKEEDVRIKDLLRDYVIEIDEEISKCKECIVEALMEKARSLGEEKGIKVETRAIDKVYGISVDIVRFAEENGFYHIIVGSHGRSGISRIALGSVAEEIVEKGHCIVTVVRCEWPSGSDRKGERHW